MSHIAVLGLGAMGSRMAANLLKAGHQVTVWNRSPEPAERLVELGASSAATPRRAVKGADVAIAMLRDDAASRQVWLDPDEGALEALDPASVAVESSTLSVGYVRELARIFRQKGRSFLEAPVAGTRPQAEAAKLIFFVGGEAADLQRAEPALKSTAAAVHHLGPAGCGAVFKLAVNALLGIQAAALGELLPMLGRHGLELDRVVELLAGLPVCSPAASSLASGMARGAFAPQFPVELVAKDFGYAVAAAGSEAKAPLIWQALQLFETAIAQGLGGENLTAIIKLQSSTPAGG